MCGCVRAARRLFALNLVGGQAYGYDKRLQPGTLW